MKGTRLSLFALAVLALIFAAGRPVLAEDNPEAAQPATEQPADQSNPESSKAAPAKKAANENEIVISDFDTGDKPSNIGGDFGAWDKDPNDETQGTQMGFESDDALGDPSGYSIKLDYDVDSPNPAYNGFWMKLNGENATKYNTLNFHLKGDAQSGFTKRVKIELKDMSNKPSPYIVTGVTDQWQKFSIPFEKFRRVQDWSALNEFVVVFDDINSNPKKGSIYVDHVTFSKE